MHDRLTGLEIQIFADFIGVGAVAAHFAVMPSLRRNDFADRQSLLRLVFQETLPSA